jgi:altronate hydrolase
MAVLLLHPDDDVAVALTDLAPGDVVAVAGRRLPVLVAVAAGHKIAVRDLQAGAVVRKYGQVIGGADTAAFTACLADPAVRLLTLTVTEAGYRPARAL